MGKMSILTAETAWHLSSLAIDTLHYYSQAHVISMGTTINWS